MIKPFLCCVLIIVSFTHLSAQKKKFIPASSGSKKEIKINISYTYDRESEDHSFGNVAPVLVLKNKRNHLHEVELNTLNFKAYTDTYNDPWGNPIEADITEFGAGIRYQFSYRLMKEEKTLNPFIGLSALSLYTSFANRPLVTNAYPRTTRYFNEIISIVPHLKYNVSNRVFMNFDLPLQVINFEYFFQRIENPAIPLRQQSNAGYEIDYSFMPEIHVRLGIGVKL